MEKMALSIPEVAEACGLSCGHVRKLIRDGALPHIRFGMRILVPCRALEALLDRAMLPAPAQVEEERR